MRFAFVHGVSDIALPGHPAHTASLLRRFQDHDNPGLDREVAIEWKQLLAQGITKVVAARAKEANVNSADASIDANRREIVRLDAEIRKCNIAILTANVSAACETWLWMVGLPGVGAGVAVAISVPAQWEKIAYCEKVKQLKERNQGLNRSNTAWRHEKTAQELQQEADTKKSLVYLQ